MKTTIYVTRHGQTQWNVEGRMQGHQDSPLTEQGISQASWLRDTLHHLDFAAIYTSSSLRARRTAEILLHQRSCDVIGSDDLREIYMGDWEGRTGQEVQQQDPAAFRTFWDDPHLYTPTNGGESYYDLQKRVLPLLNLILKEHEGKTILIVTHAGTLKVILSYFEGRSLARLWHPPFISPTALCKVIVEDQQPFIELYGDTSHYQEVNE